MKICIIRTGAIGDVVHTTNLIHSIKKAYPNVEIHYATSNLIKPLIENDKDIQNVHVWNAKFSLFSSYAKELANQIKQEKYDLVINLQPSLKIKGVLFLSGIKSVLTYKKTFKIFTIIKNHVIINNFIFFNDFIWVKHIIILDFIFQNY